MLVIPMDHCLSSGTESYSVKRQFRILRYILNAFMLRRTKALLVERGTLTLPPVTEMTVLGPPHETEF